MANGGFEFGTDFLAYCGRDIREIYDYWNKQRGERVMPSRSDLDPLDIPRLLRGITLVDVKCHDPLQLIYRLVGTREVEFRGQDPTGMSVADSFRGPSAENAMRSYGVVIERREPMFRRDFLDSQSGHSVREERIFLPLSNDDDLVNMVLVYASDHIVGE